jgi:CheY-like chemotaxis protein
MSYARMPGMNGIELLANIKNIEHKIKAMIMTAFDVDTVKLESKI